MKKHKQLIKQPTVSKAAYAGFLYQTFIKRPFGYLVAILYVVYLAVILLIVPSIMKVNPLFIWNVGGFNMAMFNLFFIAASASAAAVAIFRTGIEDGTELNLSSKPITKRARVLIKTGVYLSIMLIFCLLATAIVCLIKPIFGTYDLFLNPTGIEQEKYVGIILSILLGNILNMLIFGGLAVLISMVGGQVIIIIGTVGVAFVMCLMNVIYPLAVSSPLRILSDRYNTSINSYSCNTRSQFNKTDTPHKNFAAIQCLTEADGSELKHFDTREYWTRANAASGRTITNYIDFAKQLSSLFSTFGIDKSKLEEASKLSIGTNNGFRYHILPETHITEEKILENQDYPIGIYSTSTKQGVTYPIMRLLGGNMGLEKNNWYAWSTVSQTNFNADFMASLSFDSLSTSIPFRAALGQTWWRLSDINVNQQQIDAANALFDQLYDDELTEKLADEKLNSYPLGGLDPMSAAWYIQNDESGAFFEKGKFEDLEPIEKFRIVSQIESVWLIRAQDEQIKMIKDYCGEEDNFPFKSITIKNWYNDRVKSDSGTVWYEKDYFHQKQLENIYYSAPIVCQIDKTDYVFWAKPCTFTVEYAETYSNLYQYDVTNVYNVYALVAAWSIIAVGLFTTAIIIYRKTDFK